MMTIRTRFIVLVLAIVFLGACTTVNRGVTDILFIDTVPQGATVTLGIEKLSGVPIFCAATPCALAVQRGQEFTVQITLDGYEPHELFITNLSQRASLAGTLIGNPTAGGALIAGSAAYSGAIFADIAALGGGSSGLVGSTVATVAGPVGGVAAGFVVIDLASRASRNLAPNPVVLALAPEGSAVPVDPRIALFREKERLHRKRDRVCRNDPGLPSKPACVEAQDAYKEVARAMRAANKAVFTPPVDQASGDEKSSTDNKSD